MTLAACCCTRSYKVVQGGGLRGEAAIVLELGNILCLLGSLANCLPDGFLVR